MKTLVIFNKDWADEFDVSNYAIFEQSKEEVEKFLKEEVVGKPLYFGTNEGWDEGEIDMNDFELKEITDEQAEVIKELLGTSFGTGYIV